MSGRRVICGLKLTHDGAVALIRDGSLLFSTEAEKLDNRPRYSGLRGAADIAEILRSEGVDPGEVTHVAVDGWAPRHDGSSFVSIVDSVGREHSLDVAGYADPVLPAGPPRAVLRDTAAIGTGPPHFASYSHATGHLMASYCTSPFARAGRPALGVVWDGGMPPYLYAVDPVRGTVRCLGSVAELSGGVYPIFASHFDPFRVDRRSTDPDRAFGMEALLPVSGKAMAYAALGKPAEEAIETMAAVTAALGPIDTPMRSYVWSRETLDRLRSLELTDAELLASLQEFMFRVLLSGLRAAVDGDRELAGLPLCLSGGCALNIKWNAGLRASDLFDDVWVPPFPNDAGSAIGTACAEMARVTGELRVEWSEFGGPRLRDGGDPPDGWSARDCPIETVAEILHREGEPVVVLAGRAELGPRALGHRSIVAPATDASMKDTLNRLKQREWYRPVAPICLQEYAAQVFAPGTRDPYMLFDHEVRAEWLDRIPAVVHVDGSARLQTVDAGNRPTYELLREYHRLSGIPVLCNTSANLSGHGFFPDAASALRWGQTRYVWADGRLFSKLTGRR